MWRKVARNSAVRQAAPLQQSMARFITGDAAVTAGHVEQDLDRLRQLIAALVAAIGDAGRQFAQRHAMRFSPMEIASIAAQEGPRFVSREARAWRKYQQIAGTLDEATMENEIMQAVAAYAEALMASRTARAARSAQPSDEPGGAGP
jgi:hypothetical protein